MGLDVELGTTESCLSHVPGGAVTAWPPAHATLAELSLAADVFCPRGGRGPDHKEGISSLSPPQNQAHVCDTEQVLFKAS